MTVFMFLLVCLGGSCTWQQDPTPYATPIGCLVEAQRVAASYESQNPGKVRKVRCGPAERGRLA